MPFIKKMPAIKYFKALVLMFKTVKNSPLLKTYKLRYNKKLLVP